MWSRPLGQQCDKFDSIVMVTFREAVPFGSQGRADHRFRGIRKNKWLYVFYSFGLRYQGINTSTSALCARLHVPHLHVAAPCIEGKTPKSSTEQAEKLLYEVEIDDKGMLWPYCPGKKEYDGFLKLPRHERPSLRSCGGGPCAQSPHELGLPLSINGKDVRYYFLLSPVRLGPKGLAAALGPSGADAMSIWALLLRPLHIVHTDPTLHVQNCADHDPAKARREEERLCKLDWKQTAGFFSPFVDVLGKHTVEPEELVAPNHFLRKVREEDQAVPADVRDYRRSLHEILVVDSYEYTEGLHRSFLRPALETRARLEADIKRKNTRPWGLDPEHLEPYGGSFDDLYFIAKLLQGADLDGSKYSSAVGSVIRFVEDHIEANAAATLLAAKLLVDWLASPAHWIIDWSVILDTDEAAPGGGLEVSWYLDNIADRSYSLHHWYVVTSLLGHSVVGTAYLRRICNTVVNLEQLNPVTEMLYVYNSRELDRTRDDVARDTIALTRVLTYANLADSPDGSGGTPDQSGTGHGQDVADDVLFPLALLWVVSDATDEASQISDPDKHRAAKARSLRRLLNVIYDGAVSRMSQAEVLRRLAAVHGELDHITEQIVPGYASLPRTAGEIELLTLAGIGAVSMQQADDIGGLLGKVGGRRPGSLLRRSPRVSSKLVLLRRNLKKLPWARMGKGLGAALASANAIVALCRAPRDDGRPLAERMLEMAGVTSDLMVSASSLAGVEGGQLVTYVPRGKLYVKAPNSMTFKPTTRGRIVLTPAASSGVAVTLTAMSVVAAAWTIYSESQSLFSAVQRGDYEEALAHGILVLSALASLVGLFASGIVASSLNLVALALFVIGMLLVYLFTNTPLEDFVEYCYFARIEGNRNKLRLFEPWVTMLKAGNTNPGRERPWPVLHQRYALENLLSQFTVSTGCFGAGVTMTKSSCCFRVKELTVAIRGVLFDRESRYHLTFRPFTAELQRKTPQDAIITVSIDPLKLSAKGQPVQLDGLNVVTRADEEPEGPIPWRYPTRVPVGGGESHLVARSRLFDNIRAYKMSRAGEGDSYRIEMDGVRFTVPSEEPTPRHFGLLLEVVLRRGSGTCVELRDAPAVLSYDRHNRNEVATIYTGNESVGNQYTKLVLPPVPEDDR